MSSLIAIVGPTAVGKTKLSILLAKRMGAQIISADAMQFYKGLSIGTAKTSLDEMDDVKHHLIDFLEPEASFSVADYQKIVRSKIDELMERNIPVILVGGSGLYLQAVLYGYEFSGDRRSRETEEPYSSLSNEELFELLKKKNPEIAFSVHQNNRRRLLRSLEIASEKEAGFSMRGKVPHYPDLEVYGLRLSRPELNDRINKRVDEMMEKGLLDEVKALFERGVKGQSVMAIGYKELYAYLNGEASLLEAIEAIKLHSRRYAKRQMTWFTNKMDAVWFDVDQLSVEEIASIIMEKQKERND